MYTAHYILGKINPEWETLRQTIVNIQKSKEEEKGEERGGGEEKEGEKEEEGTGGGGGRRKRGRRKIIISFRFLGSNYRIHILFKIGHTGLQNTIQRN